MSNEFEIHCFGNLTIEELEECKEDFLSMCNSEIQAKTIAKEFDELTTDITPGKYMQSIVAQRLLSFADKYPNNSDIWANDWTADRMHGILSGWKDPDPIYDKDGKYNWRQLILDFHKDKE